MRTFLRLAILAIGLTGADAPSSAADPLSAILDKAIAAHGGADMLRKHKGAALHSKARGTIHQPQTIPFVEEVFLQPPGKSRKVTEMEINGKKTNFVMVSDGQKSWLGFDGQVRESNAAETAESQESRNHGDVLDFARLKQRLGDLTPLDEIEVNGRAAVGMQVQTTGHREMQLYFDRESGFLVKTRTWKKYPMTGKMFAEDKVFSDYQDTDGYKWPRHVVAYRDGKKFLTKEVTEFNLPGKIEDSVFAQP